MDPEALERAEREDLEALVCEVLSEVELDLILEAWSGI